MYTYEIETNKEIHDEFIKSSNLVNLLQSSSWANIKDNWKNEIITFYKDDQIVSSTSLLIKPLPLGYTMIYVPRGPILDYTNKELVNFVSKTLKEYGKSKKALFVKIDPAISYQSKQVGEDWVKNEQADEIIKNIQDSGAKWSGLTMDMTETIQPRFNALLYKDNFSEEKLMKKSKNFARKLKKAKKSETEIKIGRDELVNDFSIIMHKTENRKGVSLRNADYYQKLLDNYPDSYILLVYLNIQKLLADSQVNLDQLEERKASGQVTAEKKIKKLESDIETASKKLANAKKIAEDYPNQDLIPISGTLTVIFGPTAETLYAGTDTYFSNFYPSYLSWFASTEHAFSDEVGASELNMGGLENSLSEDDGLLNFKKNYDPTIEEGIGEFDIPVNKFLFSLSENAYKIRKKLKSSH